MALSIQRCLKESKNASCDVMLNRCFKRHSFEVSNSLSSCTDIASLFREECIYNHYSFAIIVKDKTVNT